MDERISRRGFLGRSTGLAGGLLLSRVVPTMTALAAAGPTRPLLLMHGFGDQLGTWYRSDNAIVARLTQAGYRWESLQLIPFAYPGLPDYPSYEDSQGDIASAGLSLAQAIRGAAGRGSDGQVDLLGFSMGGLVSRWAINYLRDERGAAGSLVNTAVMIATPNNGADILEWLARLSQDTQLAVNDLARELANLDLDSIAAQQMLPRSGFLAALNDPNRADDRVRYSTLAGSLQVHVQLWALDSTFAVGDGVVSPASVSYLPGVRARCYQLADQLGANGEAVWSAVKRSGVFHERLMFNDTAALAATSELAPWSTTLRSELETRLTGSGLTLTA